jgi:thioglycine synthase
MKNVSSTGESLSTRVAPALETLQRITPLCRKIGVTRIADITSMDRLGISNYAAILPGTEDTIWVYGGKGATSLDAKISAMMEAIERYYSMGSNYKGTVIHGNFSELVKSYDKVLHSSEVVEPVNQNFNYGKDIMEYLPGFDLMTNETVLVPAEIALYRYSPKRPFKKAFLLSHTNGLASGLFLEEAIAHALSEVIERDAVSLADLVASSIPYTVLHEIDRVLEQQYHIDPIALEERFVDDSSFHEDVDISEAANGFQFLKAVLEKFREAKIPLLVKNITQDDLPIPTFVASSIEWITHDYAYFARGYGTNPDAKIALIRAITEMSQTRVANIQGARDDLRRMHYDQSDHIASTKWEFMQASSGEAWVKNCRKIAQFSDVRTCKNKDILKDIRYILACLKQAGLKRAIIVELTDPEVGIPVVRAIVPGLETFEITQSVVGRRAREFFVASYSTERHNQ